ncbi:MAG: beta-galactosidase [Armatimonadota bacterium]
MLSLRAAICFLLIIIAVSMAVAGNIETNTPIKTVDGQSLKSIYFFPHWWEPWKSDDAAVTADLKKMSGLGINTVCLDHEVSQALDNEWAWLDREYKLAGQEKMYVLPWLQLHGVDRQNLMKFSHLPLKTAVNQDKQVEEDCVSFRDSEFKHALARYISAYLDRYKNDPALLRINFNGQVRPVVGMVLEVGWRNTSGLPLSFDEDTNAYFRKWMKASYHNLAQLNKKWGTTYKTFDEIDPCDKTIFDYTFSDKNNMPVAVREHMAFRARVINDAFEDVAKEVRKRHKDILFAAEVAYPFGIDDPDAAAFKWNNANDMRVVNFADMVYIRTMGNTAKDQVKKDQEALILNGKSVVLAYRFFEDSSRNKATSFALDCAMTANGIGYYSWNEKADNASSIYDNPGQQDMISLMCSTYDLINDTNKRHDTMFTTMAPMPVVAPAVTVEIPGATDSSAASESCSPAAVPSKAESGQPAPTAVPAPTPAADQTVTPVPPAVVLPITPIAPAAPASPAPAPAPAPTAEPVKK